MPWRKTLYPCLPKEIEDALRGQAEGCLSSLEEIRAHVGQPLELVTAGKRICLSLVVDAQQMERLLAALSGYALYRCERELAQGYLPVDGGHRAGVCGRMVMEDGLWRMSEITSVCIRVCRYIPGAAASVYDQLLGESGCARRVLFLGVPGSGKTTVLRDAAVYLAEKQGLHVAAADEREELFAAGSAGSVDVLSGMDKARAISLLLRSMAPQVIVTDEIGSCEDAKAIEDIARCGVGLLASAHADGLEECLLRPVLRRLMDGRAFDRYILLRRNAGMLAFRVWDQNGREIRRGEGNGHGQLGCGGDGDDCHQRIGVSDFGRGAAARAMDSGDAPLSAEDERCHPLRAAGAWHAAAAD